LQGAPLTASILETEILPARLEAYDPGDLDALTAAGEVIWVGVEPVGDHDGRIALYLADQLPRLLPPDAARLTPGPTPDRSDRESAILDYLRARGASFFAALHEGVGGGYPAETVKALWTLVWQGVVTNDTFHSLRAFTRVRPSRRRDRGREGSAFRSRRAAPPSAEGRWAVVSPSAPHKTNTTRWAAAVTQQLLTRHGVLTREALNTETIPGGFGLIYPVLKGLEEAGRLRRGYFVAGLGATQFALPGALDLIRSLRTAPDDIEVAMLAATDPANPYGAALRWPARRTTQNTLNTQTETSSASSASSAFNVDVGRGPTRSVGATVILVDGALAAYLARGDRQLLTYLPETEPDRSKVARAVARVLIARARTGGETPRGMLIEEIDGSVPSAHLLAPFLIEQGFVAGAMGMQATYVSRQTPAAGRQSTVASHVADARRPPRSAVSSPFARRVFETDESE
jgi:ATP-dependent Lhr-like helicase